MPRKTSHYKQPLRLSNQALLSSCSSTDNNHAPCGTQRTSIRLFCTRLHSGMCVAFWNLKECEIGLCSCDLSDR